ncbi:hypothetical protein BAU28_26640 [Bacillus paramycoides]|uniref:Uncharacterized protein n=1 Tax=Bacillus paramycoides TaxID=2026194 RepID=A0A1J9UR25_9BACI|nr:hypothetical protein BAU28_26640 [Bacillus paramycoides]
MFIILGYFCRLVSGNVKTIGKVVGTAEEIEKKRKTLRRLQKQLTSQSVQRFLMRLLSALKN